MKVFISWSGPLSKAVAETLDDWLQCVLQAIDPWMSSKDIDRGSLWFNKISDQLSATNLGIVCLTQENKLNPWILFESGALAKGLTSSRVCTLLIDLKPEDIDDPLAQFNHTYPTKEGIYALVSTINNTLPERALKEKVLEKVFDTYWPQFEKRFKEALKRHPAGQSPEPRTPEDLMGEVLRSVRRMDRRLLDVEASRGHSSSDHWYEVNHPKRATDMSIHEMSRTIFSLMEEGMPHEHIFEFASDRGIPFDIVKDIINAHSRSSKATKKKG